MALKNRKFQTLAEARSFHKTQIKNGANSHWHIRKIPDARKWKFFVGSDFEWLNL